MGYPSVTNESVKSVSELGGDQTKLPHSTKIYSPQLDKTIEEAIVDGTIGGGDSFNIDTLEYGVQVQEEFKTSALTFENAAETKGLIENQQFKMEFSNRTIGVAGNDITLSVAPSFILEVGCIIVQGINHVKITALTSQTEFAVSDGSLLVNGNAIISQVYESINLNSISGTIDGESVILSSVFTENIDKVLVFYRDGVFEQSGNIPKIGYSLTVDNTNWTNNLSRNMDYLQQLESVIINNNGNDLRVRFFAVDTVGDGIVELKRFGIYFHVLP